MRVKYSKQYRYFNKAMKKMYQKVNTNITFKQFRETMKINAINNYLFQKQVQQDKKNGTFQNYQNSIQKVLRKNQSRSFSKLFSQKKSSIFSQKNIKKTIKSELYRKTNEYLNEGEIIMHNILNNLLNKEEKKAFTKLLLKNEKLRLKDIELIRNESKIVGTKDYEYVVKDIKNNRLLDYSFRFKNQEENNAFDDSLYEIDNEDDIYDINNEVMKLINENNTNNSNNLGDTPINERKIVFGKRVTDENFKNKIEEAKKLILK